MIKIKKILKMFLSYVKIVKISQYTDEKLESSVRSKIHSVEKSILENKYDSYSMLEARCLFSEARERDILSEDEINWGERILFGNAIQKAKKTQIKINNEDLEYDIMQILKNRRSIRSYTDKEIEKEKFKMLVDAARWAPSSCNRQPWHFLITEDKDKIEFLSQIKGQNFIENAPYCILVLMNSDAYTNLNKEKRNYFMFSDSAAANENLLLMVHKLNLGACWVNLSPTSISSEEKRKLKEKFKIPDSFEAVTIIPIGYPESQVTPPGRKNIDDIMHFESYNEK